MGFVVVIRGKAWANKIGFAKIFLAMDAIWFPFVDNIANGLIHSVILLNIITIIGLIG